MLDGAPTLPQTHVGAGAGRVRSLEYLKYAKERILFLVSKGTDDRGQLTDASIKYHEEPAARRYKYRSHLRELTDAYKTYKKDHGTVFANKFSDFMVKLVTRQVMDGIAENAWGPPLLPDDYEGLRFAFSLRARNQAELPDPRTYEPYAWEEPLDTEPVRKPGPIGEWFAKTFLRVLGWILRPGLT